MTPLELSEWSVTHNHNVILVGVIQLNCILLNVILLNVILLNAVMMINIRKEILQNGTILKATLPCVILMNVTTLFINCYKTFFHQARVTQCKKQVK
jgi:hypothetical protein